MAGERRPLVAGNWKMHGLRASSAEVERVAAGARELAGRADLMIFPPATLIAGFASLVAGSGLAIGGQDCHAQPCGAHTGDIAAEMLRDAGASAVILGHSERRAGHAESDAQVCAKVLAARRAGLLAIVCVGETRAQREVGKTLDIVGGQLAGSLPEGVRADGLVVAYEPVWAIGSGLTPTAADVTEVHLFIRARLASRLGAEGERISILYGGSVKPSNARELMALDNVDGALVGGASLKADDFLAIARCYRDL